MGAAGSLRQVTERELHEPVALCRSDGQLDRDAVGWSRHPVHECALPGSWGRRKRWDYWCVTGPRRVLSITYANVDYLGLADAWFLDLPTGRTATCSVLAPGGRSFSLPDHVAGGDMEVAQGGTRIAIREEAEGTRLVASSKNLECDVLVGRPPGHETL